MKIIEIILVGIGLAMDAFAVAVCKGLSMKEFKLNKCLIIAGYFGIFQGLMPIIGYILGVSFQDIITRFDHWVAFILLGIIGLNMIKESFSKETDSITDKVDFKTMFPLAIATSIDALAVGITFAFLKVNVLTSALVITITTFILAIIGVTIGNKFGSKYEHKAEFIGGLILVIMGLKILLEHLNII